MAIVSTPNTPCVLVIKIVFADRVLPTGHTPMMSKRKLSDALPEPVTKKSRPSLASEPVISRTPRVSGTKAQERIKQLAEKSATDEEAISSPSTNASSTGVKIQPDVNSSLSDSSSSEDEGSSEGTDNAEQLK